MKLNIANKLRLSFILIAILLIFASVFSILIIRSSILSLKDISDNKLVLSINILTLQENVLKQKNTLEKILLYGANNNIFREQIEELESLQQKQNELVEKLKTNGNSYKQIKNDYNSLIEAVASESQYMERILNVYRSEGRKAAADYLYSNLSEVDKISNNLNKKIERTALQELLNASEKAKLAIIITVIIFIITVFIAIIISNTVSGKISSNVTYLINAANEASLGAVDNPINLESDDELEEIAKVMEYLRIKIKKSIKLLMKAKHK